MTDAAESIASHGLTTLPTHGIVLGSDLGPLADEAEGAIKFPCAAVPALGKPLSFAPAHLKRLAG